MSLRVVGMGSWLLFHSVAKETVTSICCSKAGWTCDRRPQTTPELWTSSVCSYLDMRLLGTKMKTSRFKEDNEDKILICSLREEKTKSSPSGRRKTSLW